MKWYNKITTDILIIEDCIQYFENEYESAKLELNINGNIETHCSLLPGVIENRYSQLQELEAILEFLNIELKKIRSLAFKKYFEHYNKSLNQTVCAKYVDGDPSVVEMELLVNSFALLRNKYLSIIKGLDTKNWMLGHISKMRVAGIEDAYIG